MASDRYVSLSGSKNIFAKDKEESNPNTEKDVVECETKT
jgi:hypothetical protein